MFEDDLSNMEWFQKWDMLIFNQLKLYEEQIKLNTRFNTILRQSRSANILDHDTNASMNEISNSIEHLNEIYSNLFLTDYNELVKTMGSLGIATPIQLNIRCETFFNNNKSNVMIDWNQIPYETHQILLQLNIIEFKINSIKPKSKADRLTVKMFENIKKLCEKIEESIDIYNKIVYSPLIKGMLKNFRLTIPNIVLTENALSAPSSSSSSSASFTFSEVTETSDERQMRIGHYHLMEQIEMSQNSRENNKNYQLLNELFSWNEIWINICTVSEQLLSIGLRVLQSAEKIRDKLLFLDEFRTVPLFDNALNAIDSWINKIWSVYGGNAAMKLRRIFDGQTILIGEYEIETLKNTLHTLINYDSNGNSRRAMDFFYWALDHYNNIIELIEKRDWNEINYICQEIIKRAETSFNYVIVCMRVYNTIINIYNRILDF